MRTALRVAPALLLVLAACGGSSTAPAPTISAQPVDAVVLRDLPATFTVVASGASTYQWRKNGADIGGATGATYTTPATVAGDDHAIFSVVVGSEGGSVTSTGATLRVVLPPTITAAPESTAVALGGEASFTVTASGNGALGYQWSKDGAALDGATGATLTITGATQDQAGGYSCAVSNAIGAVKATREASASLAVLSTPVVTLQPAGATLVPGDAWTFRAAATVLNAEPVYQWQKDGVDIAGATAPTFGFAAATTADAGRYTCVVSNVAYGTAVSATTAPADVVVLLTPVITAQPGARRVVEGQPATYRVVAKGAGTLGYQWQRDGADVPGATSASYTTPAAAAGDEGATFRAVVTNAGGSVTSAAAALSVLPAVAGLTASATTVSLGECLTLSYVVPPGTTATLTAGAAAPAPVATGSQVACPSDTTAPTTYVLSITGGAGTTTHQVGVAVKTYTPRALHVPNWGSDDVSSWLVDAFGNLTSTGAPAPAGHQPIHAVASPGEDRLYVSNAGDGTVSGYAVDAASGALTALPGSPFHLSGAAAAPWAAAMAPGGAWLYVACAEGIEVMAVDAASGALTLVPGLAVSIPGRLRGDVVIHPSGRSLYVADAGHAAVKGYAVGVNGALTFTGEAPAGLDLHGLSLDRTGTVLLARGASPVPTFVGQLDAIAVEADGTLGAASTWAGFGMNAFFGVELPWVKGASGRHGVATSRRPGIDMVFDSYDGEITMNTSFSSYQLDPPTARVTAEWVDPTGTGFSSPTWVASGFDILPSGDSVVVDRSGGFLVMPIAGGWDRLYAWTQAADATIFFVGDLMGQTWQPTGANPAHACFTGTLQ